MSYTNNDFEFYMLTTGYHTVEDRGNADEVEKKGPFLTKNQNAWLGVGYYFWDDDIERAHDWGREIYPKNGYIICKGELSLEDEVFLDLCSRDGKRILRELIDVLKSEFSSGYGSETLSIGQTITHLLKISQYPNYKDVFPFKCVRCEDWPKKTLVPFSKGPEAMSLNPRVQICLFEKTPLLLRSFRIIYPDEYVED